MKLKNILTGAIALSLLSSAQADVTVDITGATAFRVATLDTIKARFVASGQPFKFAHDRTLAQGFNGATRSVWIGTFPGVTGTTTIRTSFNGSIEGIRALVDSPAADPTYLLTTVLDSTTAVVGGAEVASTTSPVAAAQSEIAFSDAAITATPYSGTPLLPGDASAGVVVFTMIGNESTPANLTNITEQQFRALMSTGFQPLSLLTGDTADAGSFVFATGRNDGSGTRTTYLAESGYGISNPVQQYVTTTSTSTAITEIQRVPAGGGKAPANTGTATPGNASIIWGQDVDGNGGYSSGSALRGDMGKTSTAVQVYDADGTDLGVLPLTLVTWLSAGDAVPAKAAGAKILGYNGVTLASLAGGASVLDATDRAKVTNGQYAGWSFQQMYRRSGLVSGDAVTVYDGLRNNLGPNLGATGIPKSEMTVGRVGGDGGIITP